MDGKATFKSVKVDTELYRALQKKLALHLTMAKVNGISMLRKYLGPDDIKDMPSFLGRIFRVALFSGSRDSDRDIYDYAPLYSLYDQVNGEGGSAQREEAEGTALKRWDDCRYMLGMGTPIASRSKGFDTQKTSPSERQQYVEGQIP